MATDALSVVCVGRVAIDKPSLLDMRFERKVWDDDESPRG
jgi:hypothetical protein